MLVNKPENYGLATEIISQIILRIKPLVNYKYSGHFKTEDGGKNMNVQTCFHEKKSCKVKS